MGAQRVQMKGVLPWLVRWACRASTRDFCSALAALVGPVQKNFSPTVHYFNSFVPVAQQAGQAAMLGRLSLSMCLWSENSIVLASLYMYSLNRGKEGSKTCFDQI
jgi:hypothetical protein